MCLWTCMYVCVHKGQTGHYGLQIKSQDCKGYSEKTYLKIKISKLSLNRLLLQTQSVTPLLYTQTAFPKLSKFK